MTYEEALGFKPTTLTDFVIGKMMMQHRKARDDYESSRNLAYRDIAKLGNLDVIFLISEALKTMADESSKDKQPGAKERPEGEPLGTFVNPNSYSSKNHKCLKLEVEIMLDGVPGTWNKPEDHIRYLFSNPYFLTARVMNT